MMRGAPPERDTPTLSAHDGGWAGAVVLTDDSATAGGTMLVVGLVSETSAEAQPISAGCGPAGCTLTLRGFF